jgi:hypothetical protein
MIVTKRLQNLHTAYGQVPLVVFLAPAGCGKTEAARWWAHRLGKPVVWFTLSEHPDLRQPASFRRALADRTGLAPGDGDLALTTCLDRLHAAYPTGLTLVCDDAHLADDGMAVLMGAWVAAGGTDLTLVVTTRHARRLPSLPAWQVRQRALIVDAADLQFDGNDIRRFLGTTAADTRTAQALTQGRPFALVLLHRLIRSGLPPAQWHLDSQLAPYWRQEVMQDRPASDIELLQAAAMLETFTLAEAMQWGLADVEGAIGRLLADGIFLHDDGTRYALQELARQAVLASMTPAERSHHRLQAARVLSERNDEGCLPLFIAAEAFAEAARAIAWFFVTVWREVDLETPVLQHWVAQLPASFLAGDPVGMMLHVWLHQDQPQAILIAILERVLADVSRSGDVRCRLLALLSLAGKYQREGRHQHWRHVTEAMAQAWRNGMIPAPLQAAVLSVLIRYHAQVDHDLEALEAYLRALQQHISVTPGSQAIQFEAQIEVVTAHTHCGEARRAWQAWYHALSIRPEHPDYALNLLGIDGELREMADPLQADTMPPTNHRPSQAPEAFEPLLLFDRAEIAWVEHEFAMAEELYACFLDVGTSSTAFFDTAFQQACRRLSDLRLRQGDPEGALAYCRRADQWHGNVYSRCWVTWYEAAARHALGDGDGAHAKLDDVMATAVRCRFTFLWVAARLLQGTWHGLCPTPDVRWLIGAWGYDVPLNRHHPDLLWHDACRPPRVIVHSLGRCEVLLDGRPITWKRSNALIILLDLLVHPEGSSAQDLLQRYWPMSDAAAVRKDVQVLRRALDPEARGSDSRYVVLKDGRYQLTRHPALIWWDVAGLRAVHQFGMRVDRPLHKAQREAIVPFLGDFAPELAAYTPLADLQTTLSAIQLDLQDLHRRR